MQVAESTPKYTTARADVPAPFPRYACYRDCGVEWLGEIPEHWKVSKTKRVFSIGSGTTPTSDRLDYYSDSEGVNWVTTGELRELVITETKKKITALAITDYTALRIFPKGTVLMAMYGATIGRLGVLGAPATVNQACCAFSGRLSDSNRFLYFYLWATRNTILNFAYGGGQPNISQDLLANLPIPLPPLPEQRAIADFLDQQTSHIDTLIQKKEHFIQLLEEKRSALISHAVTRGLSELQQSPDTGAKKVKFKDSGVEWLGEIPEHWELKAIKRFGRVRQGVTKGRDLRGRTTIRLPYLRVANVQDGYLKLDEIKEIEILEAELERFSLASGDILMNEGGDFDKLGRGSVWTGEIEPCIHQNHVFAVRLQEGIPRFFSWITVSKSGRDYFTLHSRQSTNLASIGSSDIRDFIVGVPPLQEQRAIADFLDQQTQRIDAIIEKTKSSIELLKEKRAALISAAVTGQIKVPGVK